MGNQQRYILITIILSAIIIYYVKNNRKQENQIKQVGGTRRRSSRKPPKPQVPSLPSDQSSSITSDTPTPINCEYTNWSDYGECQCDHQTKTTIKTRTREIRTQSSNGGMPCSTLTDSIECEVDECSKSMSTGWLICIILSITCCFIICGIGFGVLFYKKYQGNSTSQNSPTSTPTTTPTTTESQPKSQKPTSTRYSGTNFAMEGSFGRGLFGIF